MNKIRCAIYTRKSSEEGLDQDFNSLDAQREACEAYVASQKHEGWCLVEKHYDDGGLSGGNLERPALIELMRDIDDGHIDQIVVYKIDRLTRSLSDFAKLVDRLDKQEASFVSVTQSFNTATSMGRLTLKVLLSFAQFEREVTAERIRDKIAASKKKGMWMGGCVPLGYEPDGRTLKINATEAVTIRKLYELYAIQQSLNAVVIKANQLGLRSKLKITDETTSHPGKKLTRSQIHHILTNPVYSGRIRHKNKVYDGLHPAIITQNEFEKIQTTLKDQSAKQRGLNNKHCAPSLLIGKIVDEAGRCLTPTHTRKKQQRYRYYISNNPHGKNTSTNKPNQHDWRLPADAFESYIFETVKEYLLSTYKTELLIAPTAEDLSKAMESLHQIGQADENQHKELLFNCVKRINLFGTKTRITLIQDNVSKLFNVQSKLINIQRLAFETQFQTKKRGVETKFIIGSTQTNNYDPVLVQNIAKANAYYNAIKQGQTFDQIARQYRTSKRRVQHLIDLAFTSPNLVAMIMEGEQPPTLTTQFLRDHPLPSNWDEQMKLVTFR